MHKINFIPPLVLGNLKVLIASLGMPDATDVKLHHQLVVLIYMYQHAKNQFLLHNKKYNSNSF